MHMFNSYIDRVKRRALVEKGCDKVSIDALSYIGIDEVINKAIFSLNWEGLERELSIDCNVKKQPLTEDELVEVLLSKKEK